MSIEKNWKDVLLENELDEYIDIFEKNKLTDLEIISELTENDLEKLGITIMGVRKKILKIYSTNKIAKKEIIVTNNVNMEKDDVWDSENSCWICGRCGTQNYLNKCITCGKEYKGGKFMGNRDESNGHTTIVYANQPNGQSNGAGTAGFVLALIAFFFSWAPYANWLLWFLGLLFSFIGLFKSPKGLAITGFIISVIDVIIIITLATVIIGILSKIF
jgi:hypothetical protein